MPGELVGAFQDFFSESKRKQTLLEAAAAFPNSRSIAIEFAELERFDPRVADALIEHPDDVTKDAETAVADFALPTSSGKKFTPHVRFHALPDSSEVEPRDLGAANLNRLFKIEGVVSYIMEIKPMIKTALWECLHCGATTKTLTQKNTVSEPGSCRCGHGGKENFKLLEQSSDFINIQKAGIQEAVEKIRGSTPASRIELWMEDDLVNRIAPGDKVWITGIMRLKQQKPGKGQSSVYEKFVDVTHIQKVEREFEEIKYSKEEEKKIRELAADPHIYEKIQKSIAPSMWGYEEMKQAVALQLFGGNPHKEMPDGKKVRSDIHVLLIGDPGCLVADERVALGNGAIVKIGGLGQKHLQKIGQPMLTGQGYSRATATVFHAYARQPVMEIVTESGKSIKGTYNHPLLVVKNQEREWKRLDKIVVGDRVAVVPWIPCTITALQKTNWRVFQRKLGPKPKVKMPEFLTPSLAGFLGYVVGDGWTKRTSVSCNVNTEEEDLIPLLAEAIDKNFGVKPSIYVRKNKHKKPITIIDINSVDAAQNLSFLREKRIPEIVMRSGNKVAAEFLAWLFEADGCVFSKGRGSRAIQLKSANAELLRDVQTLLLRFRIHSRIVDRNLVVRRAQAIRRYAQAIGFRSRKKQAKLKKLVADCKDLHHERGKELSERVVSVRSAGVADVFDVEIPAARRFIANGVISHNTGKSMLLESVHRIAPKNVYVSGGGASGVGMTASAERNTEGEWLLKAGAMVLANGGVAIIDEFDKMNEDDRGLMHEAMEQQFVSIAKAGMITQFKSAASVLAAANPKMGRFDSMKPPGEQFAMGPALMSRFDLIFAIRDFPDETRDRGLVEHVLTSHKLASENKAPEKGSPINPEIDAELLQKYIAYARQNVFPVLTDAAIKKIEEYYIQLRKLGEKQGNVPVTPRQLEGLVRLSEASAKIRLSDKVEGSDADRAVSIVNFVLQEIFVDKETGRIDSDVINIGQSKSRIDKMRSLLGIISELEKKTDLVAIEDVFRDAAQYGMDEVYVRQLIETLERQGDLYRPKAGHVKSARKRDW